MRPQSKAVAIRELILDERCQARSEIDPEVVEDYARLYQADPSKLPPVSVFEVGGRLIVVDGYHRVTAAAHAGLGFLRHETIGKAHGLRRSNADKRRAVQMALESPIGSEQSTRVIAEHIGVSHKLVQAIRHEVEQLEPGSNTRVQTKNGRQYPKRRQVDKSDKPKGSEATVATLPPDPNREIAQLVQALRKTIRERFGDHQTLDRHLEAAWRYADDQTVIDCSLCDGGGCKFCGQGRLTKAEDRTNRDRARSQAIAEKAKA